jgi:hypothetical protein
MVYKELLEESWMLSVIFLLFFLWELLLQRILSKENPRT